MSCRVVGHTSVSCERRVVRSVLQWSPCLPTLNPAPSETSPRPHGRSFAAHLKGAAGSFRGMATGGDLGGRPPAEPPRRRLPRRTLEKQGQLPGGMALAMAHPVAYFELIELALWLELLCDSEGFADLCRPLKHDPREDVVPHLRLELEVGALAAAGYGVQFERPSRRARRPLTSQLDFTQSSSFSSGSMRCRGREPRLIPRSESNRAVRASLASTARTR